MVVEWLLWMAGWSWMFGPLLACWLLDRHVNEGSAGDELEDWIEWV